MSITSTKVLGWLKRRAKEKTTWTGIASIAAALGAPQLGYHIEQVAQVVMLVGGGLLVGVTSTPSAVDAPLGWR